MTVRILSVAIDSLRMTNSAVRLVAMITGCFVCLSATDAQVPNKSPAATKFSRIEDVIEKWTPDRHLFVKGDLGVGAVQLDELEGWLDANAPHWVVVLMNNANGETFQAADGSSYTQMDAVEHALGKQLSNRTDFGKFANPQTGELDGTVFVLFLQERKLSYYASDAQHRRNLGDGNWIGQLDQPAIRAMRSGGRIVDAVKDTVKSIDQQLARKISSEKADAERIRLELSRALDSLKSSVANSGSMIDEVKLASAGFLAKHPAAKGPLAHPPLENWRQEISTIDAEANSENVRDLQQRLAKVDDAISSYLTSYAETAGLDEEIKQLRSKVQAVAKTKAAAPSVSEAEKAFEEAEKIADNGDLGLSDALKKAETAISNGQAVVAAEYARLEREHLIRSWIRRTIAVMLALMVSLVAGILWFMNRRRRVIMQKAIKTLDERESQVAKETEGIDRLFTRNDELLGSKEKITERGYVGATRSVSEKAIDYVDDLFIMSKEVRRVLQEAKGLVAPANPLFKLINLFSGANYQQAVNLVTGKPLKFSSTNGLPWVFRERLVSDPNSSASKEMPDEITMTFEDVFQAFKQRGIDAESALNTVETCLTEVHDTLSAAQADLQKCVTQDKRLDTESVSDKYFSLPDYLETLIPSIQNDLAEADRISAFDAVGAMQNSLPTARRKMTEATELGDRLLSARERLFPKLRETADKLSELRFTSNWIDSELLTISARANELMKAAVERSIAGDTATLGADLDALVVRAEEALELGTRIRKELYPEGEALRGRIADARKKLAQQLSLSESAVLHEVDRLPDDHWSTAGKSLEAAGVSVALGQIPAARAAVDVMLAEVAQADQIIESSKKAVQAFAPEKQTASANLKRLATRLPQIKLAVDNARRQYISSALKIRSGGEATQTSSPQTIEQLVQTASSPLETVDKLLQLAEDENRQGRVLRSAGILHDAATQLAQAHDQLDQTEAHLAAIESQTRENQTALSRVAESLRALAANVRDPLITQDTLNAIANAQRGVESLDRELSTATAAPNPFEIGSRIDALEQNATALETRCAADRQANAEAARAVAGARRQFQTAQQLVRQSQTDGIPDSQPTKMANERIAALSQSLALIESQLQTPHGDWKTVDHDASRLQADLSAAADTLGGELKSASQALSVFQQASQSVFQAEQWSGSYGIRVTGSPGVRELERARVSLQQGDYNQVLEIARFAASSALAAIQQAEREVQRRQLAEERAAEAERRRRNSPSFGPIVITGGGSSGGLFGGGSFGGGSFGGGSFGGGSFGGGHSSGGSSDGGGGGSSGSNDSGFSRSGW